MILALFYVFAVLALASAAGLLFVRNLFHGAMLLLLCLLSLAAIFVLTFAEFVAVAQILIYAGGILILIIFGIMLTTKIAGHSLRVESGKWFGGVLLGIPLIALSTYWIAQQKFPSFPTGSFAGPDDLLHRLGVSWMTDYLLPFELAGLLLLLSLIGAAVTASQRHKENEP